MINERGMIYKPTDEQEDYFLLDAREEWQKLHDTGKTTMSFLSWLEWNGTNVKGERIQSKEA
jgi:hypothetical protein